MTGRRVAWSAAIAAALVIVLLLTEFAWPRWQQRRHDELNLLLPAGATLSAITVERPDGAMVFRLQPDGAWSLRHADAKEQVADKRAVELLVASIAGVHAAPLDTRREPEALKEHGLESPAATVVWTRPDGRAWRLALGKPSIGDTVHADDGARLLIVPIRILQAATQKPGHYRAKRVMGFDPAKVTRLELLRRTDVLAAGKTPRLVFLREIAEDDAAVPEWKLESPDMPANLVRIESLLSRLSALSALGFGAEDPAPADLEGAGLELPVAMVRVILGDGSALALALGSSSPGKNVWARADEGPIVEIADEIGREILLPDEFWRDNRVIRLPKWRLIHVRLRHGSDREPLLEMSREPSAPWTVAYPPDRSVTARDADVLLDLMQDVQCGRFEDEFARDERLLARAWDLRAVGSHAWTALALLGDGTPRRIEAELTPFLHEKLPYFGVRFSDEMGRVDACVVKPKAVDGVLKQALAIAGSPGAIGSSPEP